MYSMQSGTPGHITLSAITVVPFLTTLFYSRNLKSDTYKAFQWSRKMRSTPPMFFTSQMFCWMFPLSCITLPRTPAHSNILCDTSMVFSLTSSVYIFVSGGVIVEKNMAEYPQQVPSSNTVLGLRASTWSLIITPFSGPRFIIQCSLQNLSMVWYTLTGSFFVAF